MFDTPFSLALGGGAARGIAHVGVIRRLEELGYVPRAISGTSMWAIVATLSALGHTSHDMERILREVKWLSLIDFDMKRWLIKWVKIERYLDRIFEGKSFSDTRVPLVLTSTDIDTGEAVVFSTGKLSHAVRASIGVPGIFSPLHHDGRYLVDGWLTANLPIEVLPDGRVIAVSAMRDITKKISYKRRLFSLDWQKTVFSNGYTILRKTIDIVIIQNEKRSIMSRPDIIYIRPDFADMDYYEFHRYPLFIESGYAAAKAILI